MTDRGPTRRRAITIMAAACVTAGGIVPPALARREWRGTALGAKGHLIFHGLDRKSADRAIAETVAEIDRLENVFSLYRPDSEVSRLNRHGDLDRPSHDFRIVFGSALEFWRRTNGAFNPAIQPLWRMLADHFSGLPDKGRASVDPRLIADRLRFCNPADIVERDGAILLKPGMALTFNGIAQGYITDRVAELLHRHGLRNILVQLGETRALPGRSWQVVIGETGHRLKLENNAVATSAGHGTFFTRDKTWHHLIDPTTGRSGRTFQSITVRAPSALMADALSTALAASEYSEAVRIAADFPQAGIVAFGAGGEILKIANSDEAFPLHHTLS